MCDSSVKGQRKGDKERHGGAGSSRRQGQREGRRAAMAAATEGPT